MEHTAYSHIDNIAPEANLFQKLDYIYQHFQENEKIHKFPLNTYEYENSNTLYPQINNDIEYGLFEDIISSYHLDSQIKDDFQCNHNCYMNMHEAQQDQLITSCTHAYDHIAQQANNLEDPTQQHVLYTHKVNASLFTTDTATLCDCNITKEMQNLDTSSENK